MSYKKAKIRKIILGPNPKFGEGMAFQVGNNAGTNCKISQILEDTNSIHALGLVRFLVFITDGNTEFLWKSSQGVPITIEYFLPGEDHKNLV